MHEGDWHSVFIGDAVAYPQDRVRSLKLLLSKNTTTLLVSKVQTPRAPITSLGIKDLRCYSVPPAASPTPLRSKA